MIYMTNPQVWWDDSDIVTLSTKDIIKKRDKKVSSLIVQVQDLSEQVARLKRDNRELVEEVVEISRLVSRLDSDNVGLREDKTELVEINNALVCELSKRNS